MEEYIQLEEEKACRRGQEFNWETATYGKVRYFEDINNFKDFENEFPAIVYRDALTSDPKVSSEPMYGREIAQRNWARVDFLSMVRSLTKDLLTPFEELKRVLRAARKLFKTKSLDYSSSPEFDLFFDLKDQIEEEVMKTMREPTMEEYITKTREDYGSGIVRPKIDEKAQFELKGQFLKE
ncbi:hypothetical protein Tco_0413163 [Tanacetum coccineum]